MLVDQHIPATVFSAGQAYPPLFIIMFVDKDRKHVQSLTVAKWSTFKANKFKTFQLDQKENKVPAICIMFKIYSLLVVTTF